MICCVACRPARQSLPFLVYPRSPPQLAVWLLFLDYIMLNACVIVVCLGMSLLWLYNHCMLIFNAAVLIAVCYPVVRRFCTNRLVVHRTRHPCVCIHPSPSRTRISGGAPLFRGISVGDIRDLPVSFGDFTRLYDDDRLTCRSIGVNLPTPIDRQVCVRLPLHQIAPYVTSALRVQLSACLPYSYCPRNVPISELRLASTRLCCAGECIWVFASFERPVNSVVNPFHIDRVAAARRGSSVDDDSLAATREAFLADVVDVPVLRSRQFSPETFPPSPLSTVERAEIINEWCSSVSGYALHESACASCACLCPEREMVFVAVSSPLLSHLASPARSRSDQPVAMLCPESVRTIRSVFRSLLACICILYSTAV